MLVGDFPLTDWIDLFKWCYERHDLFVGESCVKFTRYHRIEWPLGGFYLEQDNILIEVFSLIKSELELVANE